MLEKGLKTKEELEEWYRKRDESIRRIQEGIKKFFYYENKNRVLE